MNVYPNPGNGHVYINIDLTKRSDGKIEVTDLYGKKVYEHQFSDAAAESIEADLSGFPKGMYFVNLRTGSDVITKKLMIQ